MAPPLPASSSSSEDEEVGKQVEEEQKGSSAMKKPKMTQATEAPFRPRELLQQKQKFFQSVQKHTYLKGRYDKITSVFIPLALTITCGSLIARGVYNMSNGIGKKE